MLSTGPTPSSFTIKDILWERTGLSCLVLKTKITKSSSYFDVMTYFQAFPIAIFYMKKKWLLNDVLSNLIGLLVLASESNKEFSIVFFTCLNSYLNSLIYSVMFQAVLDLKLQLFNMWRSLLIYFFKFTKVTTEMA